MNTGGSSSFAPNSLPLSVFSVADDAVLDLNSQDMVIDEMLDLTAVSQLGGVFSSSGSAMTDPGPLVPADDFMLGLSPEFLTAQISTTLSDL